MNRAGTVERSFDSSSRSGWSSARIAYFRLIVAATLFVAITSFIRDRGLLLSNISLWLFAVPFAATIWRLRFGFLVTLCLLTVAPAMKEQTDALLGGVFHAWAYPGVDCCLGFIAAWALRWRLKGAEEVLDLFPSGPVLLFHLWMTLSAVLAVGRNLWQSASEFSLRGFAYNVWLTRGISWLDDYYPIQDPFFYGVAVVMLIGAWGVLRNHGRALFSRMAGAVLVGATINVLFGLWQKMTGHGWVNGQLATSLNAFWPDLHAFGVFMAMALFLGYGFLANRAPKPWKRWLVATATMCAAVGLYLSGSRSTLFFVSALLLYWALWSALHLDGQRRVVALVAAAAVILAIHLTLYYGYRGFSYALLNERLHIVDPQSVNLALSYRPEIWAAALQMYFSFPLFGLGQGAFYRLSTVPDFSQSPLLLSMGGDGIHSELLRILVELGPIGLGLLLFAAIPVFRLGRANFRLVSFYALLGLLLGNLYTNAILVRELLMFAAVFAGSYFWEAQAVEPDLWRPPSERSVRYGGILLGMVGFASLGEVAASLHRAPFIYAQRCHEVRPLAKDGWTQGALRIPLPNAARLAELILSADRPDLPRRPTTLDISIIDQSATVLEMERYPLGREARQRLIQLALPETIVGERLLELKTSTCYVPLNLGVTYDARRLGVQVHATRFRAADGEEIP